MSGFSLNLASLQAKLGDATHERAKNTLLMQRVRPGFQLAATGVNAWSLFGKVDGSHREVYQVDLQLEIDEAGSVLHMSGSCECPAPFPCKHAGALTIKAAYQQGSAYAPPPKSLVAQTALPPAIPAEDRAVSEWLDLFEEPASPPADDSEPSTETGKDMAVFVVGMRRQGHREALEIRCQWVKPRKKGGYGKPRDMGMMDVSAHPGEVAEVMRLVQAMQRSHNAFSYYSGASRGVLSGHTGALALQLACDSGRLFLEGPDEDLLGPITKAPDAKLSWAWAADAAHTSLWHLVAELEGRPGVRVQQAGALVWFDAATQQWGHVDLGELSAARVQALLNMPAVAESAWWRHEAALMRQLAGLPLPPMANAPVELRGTTPKGVLRIVPSNAFERPSMGLATAYLQLDYRHAFPADHPNAALRERLIGHWSAKEQPALVSASGQADAAPERALLFRDLAAEEPWRDGLAALGLHTDREGRYRCAKGMPAHEQPWLSWASEGFSAFAHLGLEIDTSAMQGWVTHADTLAAQITPQDAEDEAASQWFDLSLGIEVDGLRVNVLPVLPSLLAAMDRSDLPAFVYVPHPEAPDARWLRVPTVTLAPWLSTLLELTQDRRASGDGQLRMLPYELMRVSADLGQGVAWAGAERIRNMLQALREGTLSPSGLPEAPLPKGLLAELRPYQQHGLNWLQFMRAHQLGGILADDMGLGKTLQTLAHVMLEKEAGRLKEPALIICPVSVIGNWKREAARFAPSLRLQVVHGLERHAVDTNSTELDVVVAPYSLLQRDRERWMARRWSMLVLDEAQHIKNASSQAAKVAQELRASQRLCLSGTPLENHLGELWSLFHFAMPGFLGSAAQFKSNFRTPIEQHADADQLERLRRRVTPFILRRSKSAVAIELPPKVETLQTVALSGKQADLYETIRLATEKSVRDALADKGLARSQIQVLDALLKLRQVCCDPRLVPSQRGKSITQSAKLERLMELLPELIEEGRKVLLFSQFTSMLELIEAELPKAGIRWVKLTGQSKNRETIIEQFTSGEVPLFLISLKAGGVGLNLQAADTVIHYDPWWNPAVENQATDRAHRIGQTEQVMVYKLVAEGTIEERMLALQARKAALAEGVLSGTAQRKEAMFTEGDLQELLKPLEA